MNVYIIDYIGVHCGMHYYLDAFKQLIASDKYKVSILSNYDDNGNIFLKHQFRGSIIRKITCLLINLFRVYKFIRKHPNDMFIYLTYGNTIDVPYMYIVSKAKYHMIDIHEAIAQHIDNKEWLKNVFRRIYTKNITTVITHSKRTEDFLSEWSYVGKSMFVPHFKYRFNKIYIESNLSPDIYDVIKKDKINLLFFGNITHAKGIDILLSAVNELDTETMKDVNVIVAGKDADGTFSTVELKYPNKVQFILRHINDDELVFLYQHSNYICMPYRKTSQSGILEMAFYFKKPIIASRIPYFEKMLNEFKSFGILAAGNNITDYSAAIKLALSFKHEDFFSDDDYSVYENRKEILSFKNNFQSILLSRN